MTAWLIPLVGEKAAKPVFYGVLILLLVGAGFTLAKCIGGNPQAVKQAEQTSKSGDAIADAAKEAVDTLEGQQATEQNIDAAVAAAQREIENADDPDAIRAVVLRSVCGQASHRADPACQMR